jgi:hypothetical protein
LVRTEYSNEEVEFSLKSTDIFFSSLNIANNEFSDKAAEELVKVLRDGLHKLSKLDLKLCGIASKPLREVITT